MPTSAVLVVYTGLLENNSHFIAAAQKLHSFDNLFVFDFDLKMNDNKNKERKMDDRWSATRLEAPKYRSLAIAEQYCNINV